MITATAVGLGLVFLTPFVLWRRLVIRERDFFHPLVVVAVINLVTVVMFLFVLAQDETLLRDDVRNHPSIEDLGRSVAWYGLVQGIGFLGLVVGFLWAAPTKLAERLPKIGMRVTPKRLNVAIVGSLLIGLGCWVLFLQRAGGYKSLLLNMYTRAELTTGAGYTLSGLAFLVFATILLVYSLRLSKSLARYVAVAAALMGTAVIYSSLGGRGPTIKLLILVLLTWHYCVKRITRIPWKAILLLAFVVPYFFVVFLLRSQPGAVEVYLQKPSGIVEDAMEIRREILQQISYVHQYLLITSYFNPSNMWWGKTFLDLIFAPVPRSIYADKPPVDDGVYIASLARGMTPQPLTPLRDLADNSLPPETLGTSYMNFWIPGVLAGMFLLGGVYKLSYRYMQLCGYSPFSVLVYVNVLLGFHLSNLRIVQTMVTIVTAAMFFGSFFGVRKASLDIWNRDSGGLQPAVEG